MSSSDRMLAHHIKLKFGTAPNAPTDYQLQQIKKEIWILVNQGITPSEEEWLLIVKKHCPTAGQCSYSGADTSDLVTLLKMATNQGT